MLGGELNEPECVADGGAVEYMPSADIGEGGMMRGLFSTVIDSPASFFIVPGGEFHGEFEPAGGDVGETSVLERWRAEPPSGERLGRIWESDDLVPSGEDRGEVAGVEELCDRDLGALFPGPLTIGRSKKLGCRSLAPLSFPLPPRMLIGLGLRGGAW